MPQRPPSSRPRRAALALTAVLVAALPACGESAADEPAAAAPAGDGAWPVTIEHAFGETTIEEEPQRVVTVGFTEADLALALGVTPVGVRDHLGYDHANRPWAVDLLPAEPLPTVGDEAIDLEAVAALEPDLVLGVYSFIDPAPASCRPSWSANSTATRWWWSACRSRTRWPTRGSPRCPSSGRTARCSSATSPRTSPPRSGSAAR